MQLVQDGTRLLTTGLVSMRRHVGFPEANQRELKSTIFTNTLTVPYSVRHSPLYFNFHINQKFQLAVLFSRHKGIKYRRAWIEEAL